MAKKWPPALTIEQEWPFCSVFAGFADAEPAKRSLVFLKDGDLHENCGEFQSKPNDGEYKH
jgi:hypothetical protein